jgi:hypothetical protein
LQPEFIKNRYRPFIFGVIIMSLIDFSTVDLLQANADVICGVFGDEGYSVSPKQLSADSVARVHHKSGTLAFVAGSSNGRALLLDLWRGVAVCFANAKTVEGVAVYGFEHGFRIKQTHCLGWTKTEKPLRCFDVDGALVRAPSKSRYVKAAEMPDYKPDFYFGLQKDESGLGELFDKAIRAAIDQAKQVGQAAKVAYEQGEFVTGGVFERCGAKQCADGSGVYLLPVVAFEADGRFEVKEVIRYQARGKHDAPTMQTRGGTVACGVVFSANNINTRKVLIVNDLDQAFDTAHTDAGAGCHIVYAPNDGATNYFKAWFEALFVGNADFIKP